MNSKGSKIYGIFMRSIGDPSDNCLLIWKEKDLKSTFSTLKILKFKQNKRLSLRRNNLWISFFLFKMIQILITLILLLTLKCNNFCMHHFRWIQTGRKKLRKKII